MIDYNDFFSAKRGGNNYECLKLLSKFINKIESSLNSIIILFTQCVIPYETLKDNLNKLYNS